MLVTVVNRQWQTEAEMLDYKDKDEDIGQPKTRAKSRWIYDILTRVSSCLLEARVWLSRLIWCRFDICCPAPRLLTQS